MTSDQPPEPLEPLSATPAAPPTVWPGLTPVPTQSKWPVVIGIIAIVLGGGGFLVGSCGTLMGLLTANLFQKTPFPTTMPAEIWRMDPAVVALTLVRALWGLVFVIFGVALLQRRRSSAPWLRIWSVIAILLALGGAVIEARSQEEKMALMRTATSMPAGGAPFIFQTRLFIFAGAAFNAAWRCAFPVFLLIWFARRKIRQEVAGWNPPLLPGAPDSQTG